MQVHRFGDLVGCHLLGPAIYLTPVEARAFANAVIACCDDVEARRYTEKKFQTFSAATPPFAADAAQRDNTIPPLERLDDGRAVAVDMETRKVLILSTAHVTNGTARWLDVNDPDDWPMYGGPYGNAGWFFYCQAENGTGRDHVPTDLFAVMQFALANGCQHVLLDRDADVIEALPHWEW